MSTRLYLLGLFYCLHQEFRLNADDYIMLLQALHYRLSADDWSLDKLNPLDDLIEVCQFLWAKSREDCELLESCIRKQALQITREYQAYAVHRAGGNGRLFDTPEELWALIRQALDTAPSTPPSKANSTDQPPPAYGVGSAEQPLFTPDNPSPLSATSEESEGVQSLLGTKVRQNPLHNQTVSTGEYVSIPWSRETIQTIPYAARPPERLPVSRIRLAQLWRLQRRAPQPAARRKFSLIKTIAQIERHGGLPVPVFEQTNQPRLKLLMLLDVGEHMDAVTRQVNLLVESFWDAGFRSDQIAYFQAVPKRDNEAVDDPLQWRVFADAECKQAEPLGSYRSHLVQGRVLVVSDGGASGVSYRQEGRLRFTQTASAFLHLLRPLTFRVIWLNPLRKDKWTGTPAQTLASLVEMYPYTAQGVEQALKRLHA